MAETNGERKPSRLERIQQRIEQLENQKKKIEQRENQKKAQRADKAADSNGSYRHEILSFA